MSRWKPPSTDISSPYITRAGYERLKAEYDHLWRERRPEVVRALAAAAAEGDRSENAEYIYRKKELREIDRRVGYLQRRLPDLKVVELRPSDASRIFFGATVGLADDDGIVREVRIVGGDETDAATHTISLYSPMARALMKKQQGEQVSVQLPSGPVRYEIVAVRYD